MLRVAFFVGAVTFQGAAAQAQAVYLEQIFDRCHGYAAGHDVVFDTTTSVEVDPTDAQITYQRVNTDAGLVTVKLIDGRDCWVYGTRFDPEHRATTIAWKDIGQRAKAWLFEPNRGTPIAKRDTQTGANVVLCRDGGLAHQDSVSSGGTDDKERALAFSSRQYPLDACS